MTNGDRSGGITRFQGCLLGCLGTLLLLVLVAVGLYYWAVTPGIQVPTDSILGADSLALMHVEGLHEDPGLSSMVQVFLTQMQLVRARQAERSDIPWFLKFLMTRQQEIDDGDVKKALRDLPRDLTVTVESIPDSTDPEVVVAVNLNRFPRVLRLVFYFVSFQGGEDFQGYTVLPLDSGKGGAATFVDQTLVWGQSAEVLRQVLQRRQRVLEGASSHILQAYNSREGRWDLYGVIENREGVLSWIVTRLSQLGKKDHGIEAPQLQQYLSGVELVRFGIDVVDADSLESEVELTCLSEEDAELLESHLAEVSTTLASSKTGDLQVSSETRRESEKIYLSLQLSHLQDEVLRRIEEAH